MPGERPLRFGPLIPHALTVARLVIAVAFPFAPREWLLGLVLVGAISDALDGFLARRLHTVSWIGALMDGIADKLFTLSVLLTVTLDGLLGWPHFGAVLARDVVNALIAAYVGAVGRWDLFRRVSARLSGKITTAAIFSMLVALLWLPEIGPPLIWLAILTSVGAAVDYGVVFVRWVVLNVEPEYLPPPSS